MKKYVIITNDRGTVVEASCYNVTENGAFLNRDAVHRINIPYTPKRRDKLRYHERIADKKRYERVVEYVKALEQLDEDAKKKEAEQC